MVIREKHKNHGMASDTESDQIEKVIGVMGSKRNGEGGIVFFGIGVFSVWRVKFVLLSCYY